MTRDFPAGNYSYIPAVFQYSSGVKAHPDFEIERVRFDQPVPLADGFSMIADYIEAADRPLTSFCACELRSPAAVDEAGFRAFNERYVTTLADWGIFDGVGTNNPVARSNVCPEIDPPLEPSFYAFCFTRPMLGARPSFVIAGGASRAAAPAAIRNESCAIAISVRPPGRTRSVLRSARWKAVSAPSATAGRIPPRRRSTPCTISMPWLPTNWCVTVRPAPA